MAIERSRLEHFVFQAVDEVGATLNAEDNVNPVVREAGFTRLRRVAETPFNHVYEARA